MPKIKKDEDLLSIALKDDAAAEGADPTFDDISPRFQRALAKAEAEDVIEAEDELEEEEIEEEEEPEEKPADLDAEEEEQEEDEDADEPRRGKPNPISKRVDRANRLLDETRAINRELMARQDAIDQKLAQQANEAEFNDFKVDTDRKIADLRTKRREAIEAGDTTLQDELDDQIGDLKADLVARTRENTAAKKALEESAAKRQTSTIVATRAQQWIRKHQRFNTDASFAGVVRGIDAAVKSEGFNPETDEYYEELDKRVRALYPDEYPKVRQRRRGPSEQRQHSAAVRRPNAEAFTIKDGKVRIPPKEFARIKRNMLNFGMDPANPNDVREYVLNNRS